MITLTATVKETFTLVEFEIPGGVCAPSDLVDLSPPEVDPKQGVALSGRGPVWLFAFLSHFYHPTAWVGTNDPRLGIVVVESHTPSVKTGDVIPLVS